MAQKAHLAASKGNAQTLSIVSLKNSCIGNRFYVVNTLLGFFFKYFQTAFYLHYITMISFTVCEIYQYNLRLSMDYWYEFVTYQSHFFNRFISLLLCHCSLKVTKDHFSRIWGHMTYGICVQKGIQVNIHHHHHIIKIIINHYNYHHRHHHVQLSYYHGVVVCTHPFVLLIEPVSLARNKHNCSGVCILLPLPIIVTFTLYLNLYGRAQRCQKTIGRPGTACSWMKNVMGVNFGLTTWTSTLGCALQYCQVTKATKHH